MVSQFPKQVKVISGKGKQKRWYLEKEKEKGCVWRGERKRLCQRRRKEKGGVWGSGRKKVMFGEEKR